MLKMNQENLINLATRTQQERQEIARKGGLARQEQRRKQIALRKALNTMLDVDNILRKYGIKRKKTTRKLTNRSIYKNKANYFSEIQEDVLEAYKKLEEQELEEERLALIRKKQIRKEINRRYYLKRKEALKKN